MMSSYFSHDSNARHDPKITAIRDEFGKDIRPYAWFFIVLEIMRDRESDGYRIKLNTTTKKSLCFELNATAGEVDAFIKCACEVDLFYLTDDGYLCSDSFLNRMAIKDDIRQKRSAAAKKRYEIAAGKKPDPETPPAEDIVDVTDKQIFDAWNSTSEAANLTRHSKLSPKIKTKIRSAIRDGYTPQQIIKAIDNYAEVLSSPTIYYFNYKWELMDFLARGLSKFAGTNWKTNFLKDKGKQKYTEEVGGDDVPIRHK
jgi:hypothetical protein